MELKKLEADLINLQDAEMKEEIEKFRHFDTINNEKITPEFLKLAKSANSEFTLRDIEKDGIPFSSEDE
jgi:spore coat protein CotF